MQKYLQKISRTVWLLLLVVAVGFFLRAYNHHDYLRFNPDQSRDASLIRDVNQGKAPIPLLGPQAGGTDFKLGGAFYQIEIMSAKIFGTAPDRLAFPDLLLSVLSIILLYFFLREFFDEKISLISATVMAVSFYAVKYARFAWNPNSTPFYVLLFLYASLQLAKKDGKQKWLWAVLIGIAAGIGVQLHSLLLFSLPVVFAIYFIYLFFQKNGSWKWAPFILLVGLVINIPQIMSEVQTGGKNTQAFFQGMQKKSSRSGTITQKFVLDATCHMQSNAFMLFPLGNDSQCDFLDASKNFKKNLNGSAGNATNFILVGDIIFALVFSLGGYSLLFYYRMREKDENKKRFLELVILYAGILFVLLIPLAAEISFRFFLVLEFMPFLLLALWLKYAQDKLSAKITAGILAIAVAIFVSTNVGALAYNFSYLSGHAKEGQNGFEEITLGEVQYMADFIKNHAGDSQNIYLQGKAGELFEITKSIQYFTDEVGLKLNNLKKNVVVGSGDKVFSIDVVKDPQKKTTAPVGTVASGRFDRVRIYEMGE